MLSAARCGAEWAWERLYRDLAPAVLGYLRGQQLTDPDDVLGEVFLQAVRDLERFDGGYPQFRSWLFTIAHHRTIDAVRRDQRRVPIEETPDEDLPDLLVDEDGAEAAALVRLTTDEVVTLLDVLAGDQREVLLLRLVGGLSHAEVATALGKSRGAVKQLNRRALSALRAHVQDVAYPRARRGTLSETT